MGLGPSHDWSSHAADAFGLMALSYEDPARLCKFSQADCISESGGCVTALLRVLKLHDAAGSAQSSKVLPK